MRALLLISLLLGSCGTGDVGNQADRAVGREADAVVEQAVQTASLTGLYEGGTGERRSQMCILDRGTGDSRFGLVLWGTGDAGCSGAGTAVRQGAVLRLTMAGDEACTIEGRIDGVNVAFPAAVPPGCAYYCGAGASLAGATFVKVGGSAEDAARARDLVGDPLCG